MLKVIFLYTSVLYPASFCTFIEEHTLTSEPTVPSEFIVLLNLVLMHHVYLGFIKCFILPLQSGHSLCIHLTSFVACSFNTFTVFDSFGVEAVTSPELH